MLLDAGAVLLTVGGVGLLLDAGLARWRGWLVRSEPLLWVLHLGYAWIGIGLLLLGLAALAADFLGQLPERVGIAGGQHQLGTVLGRQAGRHQPNAAGSARQHDNLLVERFER